MWEKNAGHAGIGGLWDEKKDTFIRMQVRTKDSRAGLDMDGRTKYGLSSSMG